MTKDILRQHLNRQIERIESVIEQRKKLSSVYSKLRLGYFIVAFFGVIYTYDLLSGPQYVLSLIVWIAGFLVLVDRHRKVYESQERFEHLRDIKKEHIARMELNWGDIPLSELQFEEKDHPFAYDLDLIGDHSLIRLLDTSIYEGGGQELLRILTNTDPEPVQIRKRQKLVKELSALQAFRDKLRVIGLFTQTHTSEKDWSLERMMAWLRSPAITGFTKPLLILSGLSLINITVLILMLNHLISPWVLIGGWVVYMVVYKFNEEKYSGMFDTAYQMDRLLERLKAILLHIEQFRFKEGSELIDFLEPFNTEGESPVSYLKKVGRLLQPAALKTNQIIWFVINAIIPWDLFFAMKIEQLKKDLEPRLSLWLDKFYQLEALNSLANFAELNPSNSYPDFEPGEGYMLQSTDLGHPLILDHKKVVNDLTVKADKNLFLITGSNMAGKSTFLRTVGINLILAYSGAPVNAKEFNTGLYRVFTSINVNDSLGDGLSHFYAEVKRLRSLLSELESVEKAPLFYFVDEIYKGTNNRERFAGSSAFLKYVAGKRGVGMVSSHDLELADLEEEIAPLTNWHFAESIEDGKMTFGYKLSSGPCPSTNALKIMEMEGLPVS